MCRQGVSLVREHLAEHPDLAVAVHYVWLPMFPRMAENRALEGAIADNAADRRVVQYWDDSQTVAKYFRTNVAPPEEAAGLEPVLWDAFLVFDGDATWANAQQHVTAFGRTIMEDRDELIAALDALHAAQAAPAPAT